MNGSIIGFGRIHCERIQRSLLIVTAVTPCFHSRNLGPCYRHMLFHKRPDKRVCALQIINGTRVVPIDNGIDGVAFSVADAFRSEEHTSELQSRENLVCRLLLEK